MARKAAAVIARLLLQIMQLISRPQKLEFPISFKASKRLPQLQMFSNYRRVLKANFYICFFLEERKSLIL